MWTSQIPLVWRLYIYLWLLWGATLTSYVTSVVERSKAKPIEVKDMHDQTPAVMAEINRFTQIYNYLEGKRLIESAKLK